MPTASAGFPPSVPTSWTSRWAAWLPRLRPTFRWDGDESLLREASDLADLERRLRRLESGRAERFGPLPRVP